MSKLGRYSADRKKVENLTATKTVTVADCGTVFTAVGDAAVTLNLPTVASAGNGWWCKVVKSGDAGGGQDVTVAGHADDGATPMSGIAVGQMGAEHLSGVTLVIADAAVIGTQVEFVCDGSNWQVLGHYSGSAGISIS